MRNSSISRRRRGRPATEGLIVSGAETGSRELLQAPCKRLRRQVTYAVASCRYNERPSVPAICNVAENSGGRRESAKRQEEDDGGQEQEEPQAR